MALNQGRAGGSPPETNTFGLALCYRYYYQISIAIKICHDATSPLSCHRGLPPCPPAASPEALACLSPPAKAAYRPRGAAPVKEHQQHQPSRVPCRTELTGRARLPPDTGKAVKQKEPAMQAGQGKFGRCINYFSGGMRSFCPGYILSGSFNMGVLASKITVYLPPLPLP